ncbi:MAG TPA: hypothetical protein EYN66_22580 [Myxococcales bacterium]|nr:hypothetical protein [Myxococcales bacterium]
MSFLDELFGSPTGRLDSYWIDVRGARQLYSFHFTLERSSNGQITMHIDVQPSYGERAAGGHATHRWRVTTDRPQICFEPLPTTKKAAKKITMGWAQRTVRYIENDTEF